VRGLAGPYAGCGAPPPGPARRALFAVGAALSLFTGTGAIRGGLRMLAIRLAAGGATFGIGRLLGVSLG